jgi:hypothetical protein
MGKARADSLIQGGEVSTTDSYEEVEEQCHNVMVMVEEPKRAPINYRASTGNGC